MGQALYRKYRSKKLSEIVGQEHITTALSNALKHGKISHAYLFTGPKGVGKTSIARILAFEINGLPYDETATHLDIIEIDAASNRRIDEIRELRERVHNAPAGAKYKVYIIDEVHMLTREAFNALLKTLEEPPAHAVFILATTEAHKLPETIVSRTQRYTFRPIEQQKVVGHLRSIAESEKISISDDALQLIAAHGEGSFRDSISLLDQIRHSGEKKISLETVQRSLGIAPCDAINGLLNALAANSPQQVLGQLRAMREQGYHAPQIAKQLSEALREGLLAQENKLPASTAAELLRHLLDVAAAHDPAGLLEIVLLETALAGQVETTPAQRLPEPEKQLSPAAPVQAKKTAKPPALAATPPEPESPAQVKEKAAAKPKSNKASPLDNQKWQEVLQAIKARHNTLYSVARMAVPTFGDGEVILAFSFPFHQKRLNEAKNKQVISDIITQTTGQNFLITCVVDVQARTVPAAIAQPVTPDADLESINNIFGGGEVLE